MVALHQGPHTMVILQVVCVLIHHTHHMSCVHATQGVVYEGREDLTPDNYLNEVAVKTDKRSLKEAVEGADVFLGVSVSWRVACM